MKITLEDCASKYEGRKVLEPADWPRAAALIRAAQCVVDAACAVRLRTMAADGATVMMIGAQPLSEALIAFRKLEQGE